MSSNYEKQITDLTEWFKTKLATLPAVTMTKSELRQGVDALKEPHLALVAEAFREWLEEKHYELSYNQICNAFFAAARDSHKLTVA